MVIHTGGPQKVRIQTVGFHYSAVDFLVPKIRFYIEIRAIFGSRTSVDSNSLVFFARKIIWTHLHPIRGPPAL